MKARYSVCFGGGATFKANKIEGFTLAEVLITLGIIGVVAAMTIPNLIANTNGAKYRSGFKKAISTLSQAGLMAQAQYDYDFAGISAPEATSGSCASDHPEENMTMCAILNGTLTGYTYRGKVSDIKRQSNTASGASSTSYYPLARVHVLGGYSNDYQNWHAYSLADGSIVAFSDRINNCTLNVGEHIGTSNLADCHGFIDVNGVTLPNKEIQCTSGITSSTIQAQGANCYVKNNANDMTDVFPIIFHDGIVEPFSNAAKYVLTTSK